MATKSSYGNALDEWKEARAVLARFDENLHDLRKYGFTFLAALLAASSLETFLKLEEKARFALIVITIVFIITLRLLDQNYQQFQGAAVIRAMILERILNIELTETISIRYRMNRWSLHIEALYIFFVLIAGGLGVVILSAAYQGWLILGVLVGIALIWAFPRTLALTLSRYRGLPNEDWIIDRLSCEQGEKVRITVTNLEEKMKIPFKPGAMVCEIKKEGDDWVHRVEAESEIFIPSYGNHSWFWDTKQAEPDKIYRVWPRGWKVPLRRSIAVYKHKQSSKNAV